MARYMLDTDTCSYVMKRSSEAVIKRLRAVPVTDVCISVITKSELLYEVSLADVLRRLSYVHLARATVQSEAFSPASVACSRRDFESSCQRASRVRSC